MSAKATFDYYYGEESNQFSFYRIPRELITGDRFKRVSTDAKLLYGLLLDRMGLSAKNGWYDEQGRVYIYYSLEEIQADLGCGHDMATKLLNELGMDKGIGLIERMKHGQGKPAMIYVKRFTTRAVPPQSPAPQPVPRPRLFSVPDCGKAEVQTAENPQSRVRDTRSLECGKPAGSYIKSNQTEFIYTYPSIHPSVSVRPGPPGLMDGYDCREEIKEKIEYDALCRQYAQEDVEEVVELIADTLCTTRPTVRIGGEDVPTPQVHDRLLRLDYSHLEYVFDCLRSNTTQIRNIRAYLLTALYNAPATISNYYRAAVQHDFGP